MAAQDDFGSLVKNDAEGIRKLRDRIVGIAKPIMFKIYRQVALT